MPSIAADAAFRHAPLYFSADDALFFYFLRFCCLLPCCYACSMQNTRRHNIPLKILRFDAAATPCRYNMLPLRRFDFAIIAITPSMLSFALLLRRLIRRRR